MYVVYDFLDKKNAVRLSTNRDTYIEHYETRLEINPDSNFESNRVFLVIPSGFEKD